jgi:FkbM family methyltransferase
MSGWTQRARRLAMAIAPPGERLPAEFRLQQRLGKLDGVLALLDLDRRLRGRAIDAGANTGTYTYAFSRIFDSVEAFEPQPWCAAGISDFARTREHVRVHRLGLSDRPRHAALHVPLVNGRWRSHLATGLGSLTPHPLLPSHRIPVDLVPLDAFGFSDVAAIKIDVEGHETEVLAGARETIARCMPTLIVEIEQRHLPEGVTVDSVFDTIGEAGYRGWFLRRGEAVPLDEFRVERDQLPYSAAVARGERAPDYVNNFIFQPAAAAPIELFEEVRRPRVNTVR